MTTFLFKGLSNIKMISDIYEAPYSVKLFKDYLDRENRDYIDYLIQNRTFVPATQVVGTVHHVQTERKIRLDYTMTGPECGIIDEALIGKSQSGCNLRERWRILYYDGTQNSFRDEHTDWTTSACHRRMSIVIALSDPSDYEGGELVFRDLNLKLKLPKNAAVVFDARLVHEVIPVTSGKRYVLQCFMFDESGWLLRKLTHNKHEFTLNTRPKDWVFSPPKWNIKEDSNAMHGKITSSGKNFIGTYEKLEDVMKVINRRSNIEVFTWVSSDYSKPLFAGKLYGWTFEEAKQARRDVSDSWIKEEKVISGILQVQKKVPEK